MDLGPKGILNLDHPNIIIVLLCFIFGFLYLLSGLFGENSSLLNLLQSLF